MNTLYYVTLSLGLLSPLASAIMSAQVPTEQEIDRLSAEVKAEARADIDQWYRDYVASLSVDHQRDIMEYIARAIEIEKSLLKPICRFTASGWQWDWYSIVPHDHEHEIDVDDSITSTIKMNPSLLEPICRTVTSQAELDLLRKQSEAILEELGATTKEQVFNTPVEPALDALDTTIGKILAYHRPHIDAMFMGDYYKLRFLAEFIIDFNRMEITLEFYRALYFNFINPTVQRGLPNPDELQPSVRLYALLEPIFKEYHAHYYYYHGEL